ncbi:MAG: hypothetical protein DSO07_04270 [Thermoproteota archaeon]|uniref:Uncharacterized protein n=1 Tax=Candidatus Methanodesulfokora washburnensis TaxID=2478471 RepID=A0A429GX22_9CREN|nr:hypothetical protein [Candidatus Methanodesulfokores washburnensis]RSN78293.1 hypothetical protein D6D85_01400 [Candidatus Methanodesulfokores washburnensis]TDA41497.1 MAG: hypothetical protein DSO07_04270 [Candidatus Korarchaeota archaeon]
MEMRSYHDTMEIARMVGRINGEISIMLNMLKERNKENLAEMLASEARWLNEVFRIILNEFKNEWLCDYMKPILSRGDE